MFGNEITIINDSNRIEVIKFEEESEIEFLKNLDWILVYDSVKDLDESLIMDFGQSIAQQKNNIAKKYNAMNNDERRVNQHLVCECERLDFKMYSLRDFLWFKQGHIQFNFPDGIDFPEGYKKVEEKGIRRILSRFKKTHR